jgi:hypothetical protein
MLCRHLRRSPGIQGTWLGWTDTRVLYSRILQESIRTALERGRPLMGLALCIRMTLNKRADTAAAAMVHRMMTRRRPLVFWLVLPFRNGSSGVETAMMAEKRRETMCTREGSGLSMKLLNGSNAFGCVAPVELTQRLQISAKPNPLSLRARHAACRSLVNGSRLRACGRPSRDRQSEDRTLNESLQDGG